MKSKTPGTNREWLAEHIDALAHPQDGLERALVEQMSGWLRYADAYRSAWGFAVGEGLRAQLESSCVSVPSRVGRLNRGVLADLITDVLEGEGYYAP